MRKKERIFTFKTDDFMADSLNEIPNKSEFIRKAVQTALDQKCPLCSGTGTLTQQQQNHLDEFLTLHSLEKCGECEAVHFVCQPTENSDLH